MDKGKRKGKRRKKGKEMEEEVEEKRGKGGKGKLNILKWKKEISEIKHSTFFSSFLVLKTIPCKFVLGT